MPELPRIVCVLGMHRSGTSLAARLVSRLGFDLGPEEALLPGAREWNRDGYGENRLFHEIDERLLARLGGCWDHPPVLEPAWEISPDVDDLAASARARIAETFGASARWVWKDPRASLTLPFWQRVLPAQSYVICVRDPVSVAASLKQRDGFAVAKAAALWLRYVSDALVHTERARRTVVFYDDLVDEPLRVMDGLAAFLGTADHWRAPGVRDGIAAAVDASLRHYRCGSAEVLASGVGFAAASLFAFLRRGSADGSAPLVTAFVRAAQAADAEATRRDERLAEAERAARAAQELLQQITSSLGFVALRGLWRAHARLAPRGTRRDRLVRRLIGALREKRF